MSNEETNDNVTPMRTIPVELKLKSKKKKKNN